MALAGCQKRNDADLLQASECSNQLRSLGPQFVLPPQGQLEVVLLIDAQKRCGDRLIGPESATFQIFDDEGVELPNTVRLEPDALGTRIRLSFNTAGPGRLHVTGTLEPTIGVFRTTWPVAEVERPTFTSAESVELVRWPGGRGVTKSNGSWRLEGPDGGTISLPGGYLFVPAKTSYWVISETARRFSYEGVELASTAVARQHPSDVTLAPVAATWDDELLLVTANGLDHFSPSGVLLERWPDPRHIGWMEFIGPRRLRLFREGRVEETDLDDLDQLTPAAFLLSDTTVWHTDEGVWMTSPSTITLLRPDGGTTRMPALKGANGRPLLDVGDCAPVLEVGETLWGQRVLWLPADLPDAGLTGRFVTDVMEFERATTSTLLSRDWRGEFVAASRR